MNHLPLRREILEIGRLAMKRVIFVVLALAVGCYAFPLSAQQDQELTNAVIAARSAETASEQFADYLRQCKVCAAFQFGGRR